MTLCDSSVIVQYIEETRPGPSLWPADPVQRARARWIEEFADTRLFDVFGWKLYFQLALKPRFFGGEPDMAVVEQVREVEVPQILDYLESLTPESGFLFGAVGAADFALAPAFVNAAAVGLEIDADRWPRLAAWLGRMKDETPLGPLNKAARTLMLVGHNPATAVTALGLLADRSEATRAPLVDYPTAGIAAFALDLDRWSDLAPGAGSLIGFWRPPKD